MIVFPVRGVTVSAPEAWAILRAGCAVVCRPWGNPIPTPQTILLATGTTWETAERVDHLEDAARAAGWGDGQLDQATPGETPLIPGRHTAWVDGQLGALGHVPTGRVVAVAALVGVHEAGWEQCPCGSWPYPGDDWVHLVVDGVRELVRPLPHTGARRGLWAAPRQLVRAVVASDLLPAT